MEYLLLSKSPSHQRDEDWAEFSQKSLVGVSTELWVISEGLYSTNTVT